VQTTVLVAGALASAVPRSYRTQRSRRPLRQRRCYGTVAGDVVRYETGRVIVIRGADNREVAYTLSPRIVVPPEVQVGRRVTLYTEPGQDGKTQLVARVTTTSVTSEGNVKRTTEETRRLPSAGPPARPLRTSPGRSRPTKPGRTLTVTQSDGSKVTYLVNEKSKVPADLVVGSTVSIRPLVNPASDQPVAETITYVTTTTTKTETVPQTESRPEPIKPRAIPRGLMIEEDSKWREARRRSSRGA